MTKTIPLKDLSLEIEDMTDGLIAAVRKTTDDLTELVRMHNIFLPGEIPTGHHGDLAFEIDEMSNALVWKVRQTTDALEHVFNARLQDRVAAVEALKAIDLNTLNKRELAAVYALLNFAVWRANIPLHTGLAMLEEEFNVNHIAHIERTQFDSVIDYLLELHTYRLSDEGVFCPTPQKGTFQRLEGEVLWDWRLCQGLEPQFAKLQLLLELQCY